MQCGCRMPEYRRGNENANSDSVRSTSPCSDSGTANDITDEHQLLEKYTRKEGKKEHGQGRFSGPTARGGELRG